MAAISFGDITVVAQGAIDPVFTPQALAALRQQMPGARIIVSTWKGAAIDGLDCDDVLLNDDPGGIGDPFSLDNGGVICNVNRQITSSTAGLKQVRTPYAIKMRNDLILTDTAFLGYFSQYPKRARAMRFLEQRVVTNHLTTRNVSRGFLRYPFMPADHFFFGLTADVLDIWDIPPMTLEDGLYFATHTRPDHLRPREMSRLTPEQHVWVSFLKKHTGIELPHYAALTPENKRLTELSFANNLVIVDDHLLGYAFPKYHTPHERRFEFIRYTHRDWQELYRRHCDRGFTMAPRTPVEDAAIRPGSEMPTYTPSDLPVRATPALPAAEPGIPPVSVVVAFHNAAPYFEQCLSSLTAQTLPGIEVILVDSASTDGSRAIAERCCAEHAHVRLLSLPENDGPAPARNLGTRLARGEFLAYVDADDWVDVEMYARLYACAQRTDADVVLCDYDAYMQKAKATRSSDQAGYLRQHDYRHGFTLTNHSLVAFSAHFGWNKLYRRSLIERYGISYPEGCLFEDMPVHFNALFAARRIAVVPEALYHYRREVDGSLSSRWHEHSLSALVADFVRVFREMTEFLDRHDLRRTFVDVLLIKALGCLWHDFLNNESGIDERANFRKLAELIGELSRDLPAHNRLSKRHRVMLGLCSPKRLPMAFPAVRRSVTRRSVRPATLRQRTAA